MLDPDVINRIAAGEVIERPASVVKELVENAVDAGAGRIEVEVQGSGQECIRVTDDGCGIPGDELPLAFERHATSKIREESDLSSVASLGFRGEALPSIASVARIQIRSLARTVGAGGASEDSGRLVEITAGRITRNSPVGMPPGTSVVVRDLFFNTPARRKFLKSPQTERRRIVEIVCQLALAFPEISFRLVLDDREVLITGGSGDVAEAALAVYGPAVRGRLIPVRYPAGEGASAVGNSSLRTSLSRPWSPKTGPPRTAPEPPSSQQEPGTPWAICAVSGFVAPDPVRGRRSGLRRSFFVNRRWVTSRLMSAAVDRGLEGTARHGGDAMVLLWLDVDPAFVDVNVHPAKSEVRFRDESAVFKAVVLALRGLLTSPLAAASLASGREREGSSGTAMVGGVSGHTDAGGVSFHDSAPRATGQSAAAYRQDEHGPPAWEGEVRAGGSPGSWRETAPAVSGLRTPGTTVGPRGLLDIDGPEPYDPASGDVRVELSRAALIGQVRRTYIVLDGASGLWLIDQHAAHERIVYDRLVREGTSTASQELIVPVSVELGIRAAAGLEGFSEMLKAVGFVLEPFGAGTWLVRAVPLAVSDRLSHGTALREFLMELAVSGDSLDESGGQTPRGGGQKACARGLAGERALRLLACKAAVKAGEALAVPEMRALVEGLAASEEPQACPHGRPVMVHLDSKEIARRFQRQEQARRPR